MALSRLAEELRAYAGIRRKEAVGECLRAMRGAWDFGNVLQGPGDDAAVLKADDGSYLLLAADGILSSLVTQDPVRAGRAAVLVNVNDIYAMGGRPLALVNVVAGVDGFRMASIAEGIREECRRLNVPMVGGHISPEGTTPFLAAGVLGKARALLMDRAAGPGQEILLALDLRGERWGASMLNWDSHVNKSARVLCADLEVLPGLAEEGLCAAAKDVSNAGILGSLAMLLEHAGLGARVDLARLEVPEPFDLLDWLKVYPSYGFLLVCDPQAGRTTLGRFRDRGIWAEWIGTTNRTQTLCLSLDGEEEVLFDFQRGGILNLGTGHTCRAATGSSQAGRKEEA